MSATFRESAETAHCRVVVGTIRYFRPVPQFDSLLYIDVLEHIESDKAELHYASRLLRNNGHLIVLSPAHQWLYTGFDESLGHFRRYNRKTLNACTPSGCTLQQMIYMDSCGMLASLGNRLLLKQSTPTLAQVRFWNSYLVRASFLFDRLTRFRIGKSILAVWTKSDSGHREGDLHR
jgi:hypothetical protein